MTSVVYVDEFLPGDLHRYCVLGQRLKDEPIKFFLSKG